MKKKLKIILELSPSSDGELKLTQEFKLSGSDEKFSKAYKVFYKELSKKLQAILDKSAKEYQKNTK